MNPLLMIAGNLIPNIFDLLAGERAGKVSEAVIKAVNDAAGSNDPVKVRETLAQNPEIAANLQIELAKIVASERKALLDNEAQRRRDELEAEAKARRDALDRDLAMQKAQFEALKARLEAEGREREQSHQDVKGAREFQTEIAEKDPYIARTPMVLSYIVTGGFFLVILIFVFMKSSLEAATPPELPKDIADKLASLSPQQIAALVQPRSEFVVQIINIGIGALSAAFATVTSFWLGSSQSSRSKDALVSNLQVRSADNQERMARENLSIVEKVVATNAAQTNITAAPATDGASMPVVSGRSSGSAFAGTTTAGIQASTDPVAEPVKPAPPGLIAEVIPQLATPHRYFPGSVTWALTASGIAIDGAKAEGTAGEPKTAHKIWKEFGKLCAASARRYGVPVELIVATIATESGGDPNARRAEPALKDESIGLMQTLVGTARFATGKASLSAGDLFDPATSIDAGTAYIASQRGSTHFDVPLVAAAYNAGSLKRDDADANRWKLHCYPRGTGRHVDNFAAWFNDAMRVSDEDDWGKVEDCPSFVQAMAVAAPSRFATDTSSPDFPPRPNFRPILSDDARRQIFGSFQFIHQPVAGNPENIRILGDWEMENIVKVDIPLKGVAGKTGQFSMRFHKVARDQLVACWVEWDAAGLLDRVLTFDGSFVPRFQRGSTTKLSNHAFGSAFDINAGFNPLGAEPAVIGQKGCVRELVSIANKHGFYWGGHFTSRPDGMHFEIAKIL